jgi:hypothetical protein
VKRDSPRFQNLARLVPVFILLVCFLRPNLLDVFDKWEFHTQTEAFSSCPTLIQHQDAPFPVKTVLTIETINYIEKTLLATQNTL